MAAFAPKDIRYIKLGPEGRWARRSLARGEMHFAYQSTSHALCLAGNWQRIFDDFVKRKRMARGQATDSVRELREFYTLGADCLWITFADGHLWWGFSAPEVVWLGNENDQHGSRMRRMLNGWRKTDLKGQALRIADLSTRLTQVQAYRRAICRVKRDPAAYLLRRIRGEEEPAVLAARRARTQMVVAAEAMIAGLHWADFEVLVDLIFARTGWQRISRLGGTQADTDLVLHEPATGEMAFIQVKSKASQTVLDDSIDRFKSDGTHARMFFICHTPKGNLTAGDRPMVHVWTAARLADMTIKAGLYDWLIEKSS